MQWGPKGPLTSEGTHIKMQMSIAVRLVSPG